MHNLFSTMLALSLLATVSPCFAGEQASQQAANGPPCDIVPKPEIQEQINRTVAAFRDVNDVNYDNLGNAFRELDDLKKMVDERTEVVRQLVYYDAHPPEGAGDQAGLYALLILERTEISDFKIVEALATCLNTSDAELLDSIQERFDVIDGVDEWRRKPLNPPNYDVYEWYIKSRVQREAQVPEPFVVYIYRNVPGMALRAFVGAHDWRFNYRNDLKWPEEKRRPILLSEHVVSDAVWRKEHGFEDKFDAAKPEALAELEKLSKHETWWVRLYVAEILYRHPEFRTPELVERLKTDEH
ncbi:MAG: hypothetical protein ACREQV_26990 [Candidatus Binatia bacterium]